MYLFYLRHYDRNSCHIDIHIFCSDQILVRQSVLSECVFPKGRFALSIRLEAGSDKGLAFIEVKVFWKPPFSLSLLSFLFFLHVKCKISYL